MNGQVWPDGPVFTVREGDLVRTTIVNRSTADHPMHLHGHHALVLSRDGVAATGSPWWTDTLQVGPGETYVVMFRADNPGIWMDHCHNLEHARAGFVLHLDYGGVGTRFQVGTATGNTPE
jgi:FtsP/CotA-like multicopper oxidase with cupredoxin domain